MKYQDSLLPLSRRDDVEVTNVMKDERYWKKHYVVESDADEIERNIKSTIFTSNGENFELIYFEKNKDVPNILTAFCSHVACIDTASKASVRASDPYHVSGSCQRLFPVTPQGFVHPTSRY